MKTIVNMNDWVHVRLTQHGIDVLKRKWDAVLKEFPQAGEFTPPKVDEDGYSRFQLWELFRAFSGEIGMCKEKCFELDIIF